MGVLGRLRAVLAVALLLRRRLSLGLLVALGREASIRRLAGCVLGLVQVVGGGLAAGSRLVACIGRLACGRLVGAAVELLGKARLLLGHQDLSDSEGEGENSKIWHAFFCPLNTG